MPTDIIPMPPKNKVKTRKNPRPNIKVLPDETEDQRKLRLLAELYRASRVFYLLWKSAYRRYTYMQDKAVPLDEDKNIINKMTDKELIELAVKYKGINKDSR